MRRWIAAKLHGLTVTDASLDYVGSVTIDGKLLHEAEISPYEAVDIVNLNNGHRWTTYALEGDAGVFTLNGGGARLGLPGDRCVVMTYRLGETFTGARTLFLDERNQITDTAEYR